MIAVISAVAAILTLLLITFIIVVCLRRRREKNLLAIAQKCELVTHKVFMCKGGTVMTKGCEVWVRGWLDCTLYSHSASLHHVCKGL